MRNNVFKAIQSSKGLIAIQSHLSTNGLKSLNTDKTENAELVAVIWKSPYASLRSNQQLERDLYRIYRKYYTRVMLESFGRFW